MIYIIKHGACPQCKYRFKSSDDEPCENCCHQYDDHFEKDEEDSDNAI